MKESNESHSTASTSEIREVTNADGVVDGAVLPFSSDEGHKRENFFLLHTRFDLNSAHGPAINNEKGGRRDSRCVVRSLLTQVAVVFL